MKIIVIIVLIVVSLILNYMCSERLSTAAAAVNNSMTSMLGSKDSS